MGRKNENTGSISAQAQQDLVSEGIDNFELPKALVTKIAKSALPDNAKLQKETMLSLVKGSTVFINMLAATAHDVALSKQHKSISATDVLKALELLDFHDLALSLQEELPIYRELSKPDKNKKTATPTISIPPVGSISAPGGSKSKGKEKERAPSANLPPPFTSVPLHAPYEGGSVSAPPAAMDVDDVENAATDIYSGSQSREADRMEVDNVPSQMEEEEEPQEEELVDNIALEESELRDDAKGVEQRGPSAESRHP